jgi:hypothetical protein
LVYVDTSGIKSNPPNFIETANNKTINIKVNDKHNLSICHFSINNAFTKLRIISGLFKALDILMNKSEDNLKNKATMLLVHNRIVTEIYRMARPFAKLGFRKAFYQKAMNDILWTLKIAEDIYDYWCLLGKLLALLSQGTTIKQTTGGQDIMSSCEWDRDGNPLIKPRYASI